MTLTLQIIEHIFRVMFSSENDNDFSVAPADHGIPGQGPDHDDLDSLLVAALDGADQHRAALVFRLCLLRLDRDRDTALARLRRDGLPAVRPL